MVVHTNVKDELKHIVLLDNKISYLPDTDIIFLLKRTTTSAGSAS